MLLVASFLFALNIKCNSRQKGQVIVFPHRLQVIKRDRREKGQVIV